MQGLADGYFVLPITILNYLSEHRLPADIDDSHPAVTEAVEVVRERVSTLLAVDGYRSVDSLHRELGALMWEKCGMERTAEGLQETLAEIWLREEFWSDVKVTGTDEELNQTLERTGRVADLFELAELSASTSCTRRRRIQTVEPAADRQAFACQAC